MNLNPYAPPKSDVGSSEPKQSASDARIEKSRGGCLTVFLALGVLVNGVTAITYAIALVRGTLFNQALPTWATVFLLSGSTVNVAACIAIFRWRRWGAYAFLVTSVAALAVNIALGLPTGTIVLGVLGAGILAYLVRPIWRFMR